MSHETALAYEMAKQVRQFVESEIVPHETALAAGDTSAQTLSADLAARAQQAGLFGVFYPPEYGGRITRLTHYLYVAEQEGRSEYAPGILGADATLDARMLHRYGNTTLKKQFLVPLTQGAAVSSYAMSEPDSIGSIPATMTCRASLHDGYWHINGKKWFICRSQTAHFATVVAKTADAPVTQALSMIVVPTDAPGFEIVRPLAVLGRFQGQSELAFTNVKVPENYLLGEPGQGIALMQQRLALGRLLRSVQWLGLAQRCFDLMCERVHSPRGKQARLVEKQLVRARVYKVYQGIATARALLFDAARKFDSGIANSIEVNVTKLTASQALSDAADCAIQIMGAEGLADWTPLSGIYRAAKTTHILDGADDALINTVGRQLLSATEPGRMFDPLHPSLSISRETQ